MKENFIHTNITIPEDELTFTASRAGGPGGQHVNKTSSRITVQWNILSTKALTPEQKERLCTKLSSQITAEGSIIVHNSSTRSQLLNKTLALRDLTEKIRKALYVPKKRVKTKIPQKAQESRLSLKKHRKNIKTMRRTTFED